MRSASLGRRRRTPPTLAWPLERTDDVAAEAAARTHDDDHGAARWRGSEDRGDTARNVTADEANRMDGDRRNQENAESRKREWRAAGGERGRETWTCRDAKPLVMTRTTTHPADASSPGVCRSGALSIDARSDFDSGAQKCEGNAA